MVFVFLAKIKFVFSQAENFNKIRKNIMADEHFNDDENIEITEDQQHDSKSDLHHVKNISGMYKNWFLDYASYVILERAVPHVSDGLKPVQRRILHSMKRMDDGRYNKVANIIGHTMQFHPHGDASIGDALVNLGQKELLIDMQGNWGNILTGDNAAAPRYIEARLSKFALDVLFNPKTTIWKLSYDGRNNEPVNLPAKFPLLLAQGVEGIAVGLASKILPHNFNELIDASIAHLKGADFEIYPDFQTAGFADVSKYNDGLRGGRVRVRAKIIKEDKKTLKIIDIPFGKTTGSLIESIIAASDKGKIKIRKIDDNTAENVEILVHLIPGTSPDMAIDALYAFTDCEISISPNACIIDDDKPYFIGVKEILRISANNTKQLLKRELEIRKFELAEAWHNTSLEKIFIENRIYNDIEDCETWEAIIETIDQGLEPFKPTLNREVTEEDIARLTEIKIKRISRFDAFKADESLKRIEDEIREVDYHLNHLTQYAVDFYQKIQNKYGEGKERRTELRNFDVIEATVVVAANEKLYVNRKEGFAGTGLKKDEYICDCSDIDDIIAFRRDGTYIISKIADKVFVGKDIIHIDVFKKNDERTIYNAVYLDGSTGNTNVKRFFVKGTTRDKEYNLTQGTANSKVLYFTANPNGEAETIKVSLKPKPRIKSLNFEFNFSEIAIKGRASIGNILTKHAVHKIILKESGISTLGGRKIWFDSTVLRLNTEDRGDYLGEFKGSDKILVFYEDGTYHLTGFELTNRFETGIIKIEKFKIGKVFTLAFYDGEQEFYYLKRFEIEESDKPQSIIGDHSNSKFVHLSDDKFARIKVKFGGADRHKEELIVDCTNFIGVKSHKARGKRIANHKIAEIIGLEPIITEEQVLSFNEEMKDFLIERPDDENIEQGNLFD